MFAAIEVEDTCQSAFEKSKVRPRGSFEWGIDDGDDGDRHIKLTEINKIKQTMDESIQGNCSHVITFHMALHILFKLRGKAVGDKGNTVRVGEGIIIHAGVSTMRVTATA
jgi:hypothetical protein